MTMTEEQWEDLCEDGVIEKKTKCSTCGDEGFIDEKETGFPLNPEPTPCPDCPGNALDVQIGGGHYKDFPIQPFEYNQRNKIPFGEASIIKYVSRHRQKNGLEDLRKAKHFLELIAEMEYGVML